MKSLNIIHNYLIFFLIIIFGLLSHHFKVHRFRIWLYWYFWSKSWGSLVKVSDIQAVMSCNRGIPCKFSNQSQPPNISIIFSFFSSLCHRFKVHRIAIWLHWDKLSKTWVFWGKVLATESDTSYNRKSYKNIKITHNYLRFWIYIHFLVHLSSFLGPQIWYLIVLIILH